MMDTEPAAVCGHEEDPATCRQCADDQLRDLMRIRALATRIAALAADAGELLKRLAGLHADLAGNCWYGNFYKDSTEDADSYDAVVVAEAAVRSVARIARERAARTRQDP